MVLKEFEFKIKNNAVKIKVKECKNLLSKTTGLMFKKNSPSLLFVFKRPNRSPIHSFFCKPFIAIWFFENKVVDVKTVKPNQLSIKPKEKFDKLLEIPENDSNFAKIVQILDGDRNI